MTARNFTIVIPGWYRTEAGTLAEVVQIMDARFGEHYPARGLDGLRWSLSGELYGTRYCDPNDLIEYIGTEKPRERRARIETLTRWANIYEGRDVATFATKEHADLRAGNGRIACVELTGEYEVEVTE